jgi:hypothetical protein
VVGHSLEENKGEVVAIATGDKGKITPAIAGVRGKRIFPLFPLKVKSTYNLEKGGKI